MAGTKDDLASPQDSADHFRQLAEAIGCVFWLSSAKFDQTLYISPAYERIWGRTVESLYEEPRSFLEAIHPEDRERVRAVVEQARSAITKEFQIDYRIVRPDAEVRWIRDRGFPIKDDSGQLLRLAGIAEDITEEKKAEETSRQRTALQEQLATLAATVPGMIFSFLRRPDGSTCMPYASPALEDLYGIRPADVATDARRALDLVHPDDIDRVQESITESARSLTPWRLEFRLRHPQKGEVWVEGHSVPQRQLDGGVLWHGFTHDITERKRAEQRLTELSNRLVLAIRAANVGIWDADMTANTLFWDDAMYGLYGRTPVEFAPSYETWLQCIHPEDRGTVAEEIQKALSGQDEYDAEFRIIWPDDSIHYIRAIGMVQRDSSGHAVRVLGTNWDITERKRAADSLRRSRSDLEKAQAVGHVGSWISDPRPTGRLEWSAETLRIFGLEAADFDGQVQTFLRLVHPADLRKVMAASEAALRAEAPFAIEHRIVRPDGTVRWVYEKAEIEFDDSGQPIRMVGVVQDITERRNLEDQLRQAQKLEAIGQLAGGVAHDFNNILAAMIMNLALLRGKTILDGEIKQGLEDLEAAANRAASLTRQLLMFGRRSVLDIKSLEISKVVENLLSMLQRLIGEDVTLRLDRAIDAPRVEADESMIEQVIVNLVVNARDAMPNGGRLTLAAEAVEISPEQAAGNPAIHPGTFVCLRVSDTGCGMDEIQLKRIFEPFFTTKPQGKGTGLGLATVHGIVTQHKGWIHVSSEVGKGSTFRVYLPATHNPETLPTEEQQVPALKHGHETILLVEDETAVRDVVRAFLKRFGYRVFEASNGAEAIALWQHHSHHVDLLLTDMVMPEGISGLEVAHRLRKERPNLPVIIASGYSDDALMQRGSDNGITYLAKPFQAAALSSALRACLDRTKTAHGAA